MGRVGDLLGGFMCSLTTKRVLDPKSSELSMKNPTKIDVEIKAIYIHATGDAVQPAMEALGNLIGGLMAMPAAIEAPPPPPKRKRKAIVGKVTEVKDAAE